MGGKTEKVKIQCKTRGRRGWECPPVGNGRSYPLRG